jgi:hypothetical protein
MARMRWLSKLGRRGAAAAAVVALIVAGAVVAVAGRQSGPEPARSATAMPGDTASSPGADTGAAVGVVTPGPPTTGSATTGSVTTGSATPGPVPAEPAPGAPNGAAADVPGGPRVVRTADVTMGVADGAFTRAFDAITAAATAEGGYVSASTTSATATTGQGGGDRGGRPRSGDVTLRVPAHRFDVVHRSLAGLGTIEQEQLRGDDVTAQIVDYDARLRSLQAEEDALRTLVGRATAVGEVLQVQSQLFDVRQQAERLQAQRDQLDGQAALATFHVSVHEPGAAVAPLPRATTGLARAVERAVAGASAVVGGSIVVLGWLSPVAVVGLLGWAVMRLRRRGPARRHARLDPSVS